MAHGNLFKIEFEYAASSNFPVFSRFFEKKTAILLLISSAGVLLPNQVEFSLIRNHRYNFYLTEARVLGPLYSRFLDNEKELRALLRVGGR